MSDPRTSVATDTTTDSGTATASGAGAGTDQGPGAGAVDRVAAQVREHLSTFDDVEVDGEGRCSLRYGSARVDASVAVFDEDQAAVHVSADCVRGATPSPELYRYVATTEPEVGHLLVVEEDDGTATVRYSHTLMGEFLNPAELRLTVVAVAWTADRFDDELAARFGGEVFDAASNHPPG